MSRIENQTGPLETYGYSPQEITFSFLGNGSSNPDVTKVQGCALVASLTHAATGEINVALNVPVNAVISHEADIDELASPDGSYCTIGNFANEGTSSNLTFTVCVFTPGGTYAQKPLADPGAGRRITVRLRVKKSASGVMK